MKSYSSREVIAILKKDGWFEVSSSGSSHRQYKHPTKKGTSYCKTSMQRHPNRNIEIYRKSIGAYLLSPTLPFYIFWRYLL